MAQGNLWNLYQFELWHKKHYNVCVCVMSSRGTRNITNSYSFSHAPRKPFQCVECWFVSNENNYKLLLVESWHKKHITICWSLSHDPRKPLQVVTCWVMTQEHHCDLYGSESWQKTPLRFIWDTQQWLLLNIRYVLCGLCPQGLYLRILKSSIHLSGLDISSRTPGFAVGD